MTHFAAFWITQMLILVGMILGYQIYGHDTLNIGMVALAVVFAVYSIGEAVCVMYPYLDDPTTEEQEDGSNDRPRIGD